uniref:Fe/B12 periplasmic-binding domain-containing protein n=1 Tax=Rhodococcus sp. NS1 TaxID=402236 RepID=A0A097SQ67_9NOCA|nr:hypothetical protein LRS1606.231 [Rhodococcus sp. NS1]
MCGPGRCAGPRLSGPAESSLSWTRPVNLVFPTVFRYLLHVEASRPVGEDGVLFQHLVLFLSGTRPWFRSLREYVPSRCADTEDENSRFAAVRRAVAAPCRRRYGTRWCPPRPCSCGHQRAYRYTRIRCPPKDFRADTTISSAGCLVAGEKSSSITPNMSPRLHRAAGTINNLNIKTIAALEPDLILGSKRRTDRLASSPRPSSPFDPGSSGKRTSCSSPPPWARRTKPPRYSTLPTTRRRHPRLARRDATDHLPHPFHVRGNPSVRKPLVHRRDPSGRRTVPTRTAGCRRTGRGGQSDTITQAEGDRAFHTGYGRPEDTGEAAVTAGPLWNQIEAVQSGCMTRIIDEAWFLALGPTGAMLIARRLRGTARPLNGSLVDDQGPRPEPSSGNRPEVTRERADAAAQNATTRSPARNCSNKCAAV